MSSQAEQSTGRPLSSVGTRYRTVNESVLTNSGINKSQLISQGMQERVKVMSQKTELLASKAQEKKDLIA